MVGPPPGDVAALWHGGVARSHRCRNWSGQNEEMRSSRDLRTTRSVLAVAGVVLAAMALVGCNGGEASLPAPKQSNTRPASGGSDPSTDADAEGTDPDSVYCQAVRKLKATDDEASSDPAKAIELLTELGKVAPDELKDSFDTLGGIVGDLAAIDSNNPDDFSKAFELVMDPKIQDAVGQIDTVTSEMCGVDLSSSGATSDDTSGSNDMPGTTVDGSAEDTFGKDLDLEHVDRIKDDNSSAKWVKLLNSTAIMNDTDVTLSAELSAPIGLSDAMEACETVRQALVLRNPDVTVTISNGETPIVKAPANGKCAAV